MPPKPPERDAQPKEAPETPRDQPQPIPIQDPLPTPSEPGTYRVPEREKDQPAPPQAGDPAGEIGPPGTETQKLLEMEANVREAMGDE